MQKEYLICPRCGLVYKTFAAQKSKTGELLCPVCKSEEDLSFVLDQKSVAECFRTLKNPEILYQYYKDTDALKEKLKSF